MANWDKLNEEFYDKLHSMVKEDWLDWHMRYKQKLKSQKMKRIKNRIIDLTSITTALLFVLFLSYLFLSICNWEIYIGNWNGFSRFIFALFLISSIWNTIFQKK